MTCTVKFILSEITTATYWAAVEHIPINTESWKKLLVGQISPKHEPSSTCESFCFSSSRPFTSFHPLLLSLPNLSLLALPIMLSVSRRLLTCVTWRAGGGGKDHTGQTGLSALSVLRPIKTSKQQQRRHRVIPPARSIHLCLCSPPHLVITYSHTSGEGWGLGGGTSVGVGSLQVKSPSA